MSPAPAECPRCETPMSGTTRCLSCSSVWVSRETLVGCIRAHLEQEGMEPDVVALHELPVGPSVLDCSACGQGMRRIKMRGIEIDSCEPCNLVLLDPGAAGLVSQRVLRSVQAARDRVERAARPGSRGRVARSFLSS